MPPGAPEPQPPGHFPGTGQARWAVTAMAGVPGLALAGAPRWVLDLAVLVVLACCVLHAIVAQRSADRRQCLESVLAYRAKARNCSCRDQPGSLLD